MRRWGWLIAFALAACGAAQAQWEMENSGTKADLRGINNVGGGVAWASGTNGTVLRTEDGGYLWQACSVPPGAEHLDFRGVQAFDANTAIVMSSGKGDLSRLYKTTDGCHTWKLVFKNPDTEGFWDAIRTDPDTGAVSVLGDPVAGTFRLFTQNPGTHEFSAKLHADNIPIWHGNPLRAAVGEAAFAASNSTLILKGKLVALAFVTGGNKSEFVEYIPDIMANHTMYSDWSRAPLPFAAGESSGAFSAVVCSCERDRRYFPIVVVGGDYKRPDASSQTAAWSADGLAFEPAQTMPHGYRSAVAYDAASNTWITVGPNGTDISTDDGRNWRALHPDPAMHEAPDADRDWNALSLPFVVGPHGRIGKLNAKALTRTEGK